MDFYLAEIVTEERGIANWRSSVIFCTPVDATSAEITDRWQKLYRSWHFSREIFKKRESLDLEKNLLTFTLVRFSPFSLFTLSKFLFHTRSFGFSILFNLGQFKSATQILQEFRRCPWLLFLPLLSFNFALIQKSLYTLIAALSSSRRAISRFERN